MHLNKLKWLSVCGIAYFLGSLGACTDFLITAEDGTIVNGRSMEFAKNLESAVVVVPRGEKRQSQAPNNQPGLAWTSLYGFVTANAFNMDYAVDGVNEQGLSLGLLWLPGTEYEKVSPQDAAKTIALEDLGFWILGNFKTVGEVMQALSKVVVWGHLLDQLGFIPPIHLALHDASGQSGVVEFINGEKQLHRNPVHVLTNAPPFDWHITNLNNYINLSALNAKPIDLNGTLLGGLGQGSGLLGIPGDWLPSSRFVRIVAFKEFALKAKNATEGVNLAGHLLNTVDIPYGDVQGEKGKPETFDYTQWVVIKDLTNKVFYFHTYEDLALKKVDLKQLDFSAGQPTRRLPMKSPAQVIDLTANLKKAVT